jgi:hypothetical protein
MVCVLLELDCGVVLTGVHLGHGAGFGQQCGGGSGHWLVLVVWAVWVEPCLLVGAGVLGSGGAALRQLAACLVSTVGISVRVVGQGDVVVCSGSRMAPCCWRSAWPTTSWPWSRCTWSAATPCWSWSWSGSRS